MEGLFKSIYIFIRTPEEKIGEVGRIILKCFL
jgi:hypothetical protein